MSTDESISRKNSLILTKEGLFPNVIRPPPAPDDLYIPFYLQYIFNIKRKDSDYEFMEDDDKVRETWDTQFQYLLSCIGYVVGIGNLWRFPAKVYQGGGGSFLIPYFSFCLLFGGPMIMLETCLGQFCRHGCSKAFGFCPLLSGLGWAISIMAYLILINYTIVISYCLLYFLSSFKATLPWSVCTNPFNTALCINTTVNLQNVTNSSDYESSTVQFWMLYVTQDQRRDGSFYQITDKLGSPNIPLMICLFVVVLVAGFTIMFGLSISGKIIYIAAIFPFIGILQFVILGCSLPGAFNGMKFYLYPSIEKLSNPELYRSALEQVIFSSGIAAGGLITISSLNKFNDKIIRNIIIVMTIDICTSFISGFATFPVLGYIAYRSGKNIHELIKGETSLFFITYPEALSTISSSNLWSILFMFIALTSGTLSLFVLMETVTTSITDYLPILLTRRNKILATMFFCIITYSVGAVLSLPGGLNWLAIFEDKVSPFVLTLTAVLEIFTICWIYGMRNFQMDVELMIGTKLNLYWVFTLCFTVPVFGTIITIFNCLSAFKPISRHGIEFPSWTVFDAWCLNLVIFSPVIIWAIIVLVKYRVTNKRLRFLAYLKSCIEPPPYWGPVSKKHWVHSTKYAKKLLKYKENTLFLNSLSRHEKIEKLVHQARKYLETGPD